MAYRPAPPWDAPPASPASRRWTLFPLPGAALAGSLALLLTAGCSGDPESSSDRDTHHEDATLTAPGFCEGDMLFGRPSSNTGLDETQCAPSCPTCDGGPFAPAGFDETTLAALRAWTLLDPPEAIQEDPYATPDAWLQARGAETLCAVQVADHAARTYRLETYDTAAAAAASGAIVTHEGACGLCSDLGSLAVYAGVGDLTAPVRACGLQGMLGGRDGPARNLACLREIGFNEACASIWYWNTVHTRGACQEVCLRLLNAPYHSEDGSLNPCLQCDEDRSGPIFKAVAGRTRRNSGLATALCRPCHEVRPLLHRYD